VRSIRLIEGDAVPSLRRIGARLGALGLVVASTCIAAAPAAHASVVVNGAGSTWSAIAVEAWAADVNATGLNINYNPVGSTSGRVFYYTDQVDFAISEIPFTSAYRDSTGTVVTNENALAAHRPYAYLPIVAGGTSFMYHLNGLSKTLNLTPDAVAKIFTGAIKEWNDPEIVKSNPGVALPPLAIRPVVRSDGSGTSAQFTAFMASQTPAVYQAFCQKVGLSPCLPTSLYPELAGEVAQVGSDGVANTVAASYENGAIGYVEYGYAKERGFPVASIENKAGYYAQPTAFDVAIALQGATFNNDNTQNLQGVYTYNDPEFGKYVYPVSSYSYMIVPTTTASPMTTDKGGPLGQFILYFACAGQQKAEQLGYSPLPKVLVADVFNAESRIPGAPKPPPLDYAHCQTPTLNGWPPKGNPPPPPPSAQQVNTPTVGGTQNRTSRGATGGAASANTPGLTMPGAQSKSSVTTYPSGVSGANSALGGPTVIGGELAAARPVNVPRGTDDAGPFLVGLAVLLLLAIVFAPPAVALWLARRQSSGPAP
jgi:phosphate transport system substrate-binding protein